MQQRVDTVQQGEALTPKPTVVTSKPVQPTVERTKAQESISIKVQRGESLSHYAAWGKISTQSIMTENALADANRLRLGQSLALPVEKRNVELFFEKRQAFLTSKGAAADTVASHSKPPWKTHKVVTGESAWLIAVRQYGISVEELAAFNPEVNLERLRPGMKLKVPTQ